MKTIFYVLSVVVIAASGYFAFANSKKIEEQINLYEQTRTTKQTVEGNIAKTDKDLEDTKGSLEEAKTNNSVLTQSLQNEKAKEDQARRAIAKYDGEIAEHDAKLEEFAKIEAEVKAMLAKEAPNLTWDQIGPEIERLKEERKQKSKQMDDLNVIVAELNKDITEKRAEHGRQTTELSEIRRRIGLNSRVGAVTVVDSTWGFVVINLGSENSNINMQSTVLITRGGQLLGRLKPNKIEPTQTVCDLNARDITPGVRIQPGDKATLAESNSGR